MFLSALLIVPLWFQLHLPGTRALPTSYPGEAGDLQLARRFAPVFYQRLVTDSTYHRLDSITNFDFDGDWIGNNNWAHAAEAKYAQKGYVYYSVIESQNYYFITYACYHARDWSFLQPLMEAGMDKIQASEAYTKMLPPELRDQIEVNHENDLEGVQVIVSKDSEPRLIAVETVAHNLFLKTMAEDLEMEGGRAKLYVESQKHGIHRYPYTPTGAIRMFDDPSGPFRIYKFTGAAQDPEKVKGDTVGYDLLPIYGTFWNRAAATREPNDTFGEVEEFGDGFCAVLTTLGQTAGSVCRLARIATALRGDVAGKNRARLPWGWSSLRDPELSGGAWFLDPGRVVRLHYPEAREAGTYVSHPFLGVFRQ